MVAAFFIVGLILTIGLAIAIWGDDDDDDDDDDWGPPGEPPGWYT